MTVSRFATALAPDFRPYFHQPSTVLEKYSVTRVCSDEGPMGCLREFLDALRVEGQAADTLSFFEASLWEPNSRIARHFGGSRSSRFLGRQDKEVECLHQAHAVHEDRICWYGLFSMHPAALPGASDFLFGTSRAVLLLERVPKGDLPDLCRRLFRAMAGEKMLTHACRAVPGMLEVVSGIPALGMAVSFGSEDFGGFFMDAFLPLPRRPAIEKQPPA